MVVDRLRKLKKALQQAMHGCCVIKIAAAHDVGDTLHGIVDHDREMIARRRIRTRQDDIAPGGRIGDLAVFT